ncbi:hypothetical protein [Halosimplex amylolyticum]|uniref:hypothetical protein n=1 Tax=Halosimplex amylolyticum TaxID=3396616 RepID=UPI003F55DB92
MTVDSASGAATPRERAAALVERAATPDALAAAYFLALGLAAFLPTLGGGFVLRLDMVFAPDAAYLQFLLDEKGPLYYGRLPVAALLDALTVVVPDWVLQRLVLVGIVAGAGGAVYAATDDLGYRARLFAGTLYAVNPFTYVRVLAGQWYFLCGYAALPLAVASFDAYLAGERERPYAAVGWATLVAVFDPHAAVLLAVAGVAVLAGAARRRGAVTLRRTSRYGALAVAANAFWLLPAGAALVAGDSQLSTVDRADLVAFASDGVVAGNVPLSVTMLYGFWRGGYVYPVDVLPFALVAALFAAVLFATALGWVVGDDALGDGLAAAGVVGVALAVGVTSPVTSPLVTALADTPVGAGMRETGKFVGLAALSYAILGGRGVDSLLAGVTDAIDRRPALTARIPAVEGETARAALGVALAVAVLLVPLAYAFPMVAGFGGQLSTAEYPDEWAAVDERLDRASGPSRTLVLPWHQYQRFDWAGGTVANPAPLYFGSGTVSSRDPEIGVGSQATDPAHRRVGRLLDGDREQFGRAVAPLGVEHVLLLKTADHGRYDFLRDQPDLSVVTETDELVLFRNEAFDSVPPPADWPRAGPRVPLRALLAGTLVSLGAVGAVAARSRNRPSTLRQE